MWGLRKQGHHPTSVDMPITPMLDMTFQLLFFFILNYHPPINEGEINYNLPPPDAVQGPAAEHPDPSSADEEKDLETKSEITVLVRTQHDGINDGAISEIRIRVLNAETPVATPNGQLDELLAKLKSLRPDLINQEDLFIQGDSRLKWAGMVSVMDACRKAGFGNVGFKPPGDI